MSTKSLPGVSQLGIGHPVLLTGDSAKLQARRIYEAAWCTYHQGDSAYDTGTPHFNLLGSFSWSTYGFSMFTVEKSKVICKRRFFLMAAESIDRQDFIAWLPPHGSSTPGVLAEDERSVEANPAAYAGGGEFVVYGQLCDYEGALKAAQISQLRNAYKIRTTLSSPLTIGRSLAELNRRDKAKQAFKKMKDESQRLMMQFYEALAPSSLGSLE